MRNGNTGVRYVRRKRKDYRKLERPIEIGSHVGDDIGAEFKNIISAAGHALPQKHKAHKQDEGG